LHYLAKAGYTKRIDVGFYKLTEKGLTTLLEYGLIKKD
jgi:hypothetical protein